MRSEGRDEELKEGEEAGVVEEEEKEEEWQATPCMCWHGSRPSFRLPVSDASKADPLSPCPPSTLLIPPSPPRYQGEQARRGARRY